MGAVDAVTWDPTGASLASGSFDANVRIWDATSGMLCRMLKGHTRGVNALVSHPTDDLLASGADDATVRVWRWSSGECVRTLKGHTRPVRSLAASADWLVSGSWDETVRVWSWASGLCARVLDGFAKQLHYNSLAWRDSTLVTLEYDYTVRVWDASSADASAWSCVALASKASSPYGVAVVGGERVACTAPDDNFTTIAVWDGVAVG